MDASQALQCHRLNILAFAVVDQRLQQLRCLIFVVGLRRIESFVERFLFFLVRQIQLGFFARRIGILRSRLLLIA
ncbi:hypothetical protein [Dyella sp.]|uniref:hypothetical protein n=1 Tax=Dyella sp. TaxID=1869338 RepID=UPI002FDB6C0E